MKKERSVKTHKELFENSIKPLITVIFIKLAKFDKFFDEIHLKLNEEVIENSLEKFLRIFSSQLYYGNSDLHVTFFRSGFSVGTDNIDLKLTTHCSFEFLDDSFTIHTKTLEEAQTEISYKEHLSSEEVDKIANYFLSYVYKSIEKAIKKQ